MQVQMNSIHVPSVSLPQLSPLLPEFTFDITQPFQTAGGFRRIMCSSAYSQKWDYVKENPVRAAGLVKMLEEPAVQGEIELLML
jgi:hypothetical protein